MLKDIELKSAYDSDEDDILSSFYIPALSNSVVYKRLAGYFSSNSFAIAAKGIAKFIQEGGKIQLIANVVLSQADFNMIKESVDRSVIEPYEEKFIEGLDKLEDELKKDHVKMLGWMLKTGKLEIKIAVVPEGLQHQKTGILEDAEGNIISFSGSDNETVKGWLYNTENFHVFCSWKGEDAKHIKADIERFDKFWNDQTKRARVFSVSEAVNEKLIKIAPKINKDFEQLSEKATKELLKRIEERIKKPTPLEKAKELLLRDYQSNAVENWFNNNKKGFFRMATGTGKTETAIGVIKRLLKEEDHLFIIIAVFGQSLLDQWVEKLRAYGYKSMGASSAAPFSNWRKEFRKKVTAVSLGYEKEAILVTTYQTFSSKDFIEIAETIACNSLLICDEVHHAGAGEFRKGLIGKYSYRLGLSATPERWFDEEGTSLLNKYFDKTVYNFPMKRALNEINPATGKTYLCHYKYYPLLVDLTAEENEKFIEFTKKIGRRIHALNKFDKEDPSLSTLLRMRADIKKNAELKIDKLNELFNEIGENLNYCIIYCSGKQMEQVKQLLQKHGRIYHEFTQHQKPEIRQKLLKEFELGRDKGGYDVLLAIDCLNEGIDLPSAKVGIFLESSLNPIEFIQRRGRLLRQNKDKDVVLLYDFIVWPALEEENGRYGETERKEMQKEFDRFIEFAHLALNTQKALKTLRPIVDKYNLVFKPTDEDVI